MRKTVAISASVQLNSTTPSSAAATPVQMGDLAVLGGKDNRENGYEAGKAVGTAVGVVAVLRTRSKTFAVSGLLKTWYDSSILPSKLSQCHSHKVSKYSPRQ